MSYLYNNEHRTATTSSLWKKDNLYIYCMPQENLFSIPSPFSEAQTHMYITFFIYIYICVCVCVCVCKILKIQFTKCFQQQPTKNTYQFCDKVCWGAVGLRTHKRLHIGPTSMEKTAYSFITFKLLVSESVLIIFQFIAGVSPNSIRFQLYLDMED